MPSVPHARTRIAERHRLAGTGNSHVEEPSLFFYVLLAQQHALAREEILLHSRHEHVRKLKALGRVHRHKCDFIVCIVFIDQVDVAKQRHILEIIVQGKDILRPFSLVTPLLLKSRYRIHKFLNVGKTRLSLDRSIIFVEGIKPALVRYLARQVEGAGGLDLLVQSVDHGAERPDFHNCRTSQPELFQVIKERRPEKAGPVRESGSDECLNRSVPYGPRRLVHHALERLFVKRVHHQLEIG